MTGLASTAPGAPYLPVAAEPPAHGKAAAEAVKSWRRIGPNRRRRSGAELLEVRKVDLVEAICRQGGDRGGHRAEGDHRPDRAADLSDLSERDFDSGTRVVGAERHGAA